MLHRPAVERHAHVVAKVDGTKRRPRVLEKVEGIADRCDAKKVENSVAVSAPLPANEHLVTCHSSRRPRITRNGKGNAPDLEARDAPTGQRAAHAVARDEHASVNRGRRRPGWIEGNPPRAHVSPDRRRTVDRPALPDGAIEDNPAAIDAAGTHCRTQPIAQLRIELRRQESLREGRIRPLDTHRQSNAALIRVLRQVHCEAAANTTLGTQDIDRFAAQLQTRRVEPQVGTTDGPIVAPSFREHVREMKIESVAVDIEPRATVIDHCRGVDAAHRRHTAIASKRNVRQFRGHSALPDLGIENECGTLDPRLRLEIVQPTLCAFVEELRVSSDPCKRLDIKGPERTEHAPRTIGSGPQGDTHASQIDLFTDDLRLQRTHSQIADATSVKVPIDICPEIADAHALFVATKVNAGRIRVHGEGRPASGIHVRTHAQTFENAIRADRHHASRDLESRQIKITCLKQHAARPCRRIERIAVQIQLKVHTARRGFTNLHPGLERHPVFERVTDRGSAPVQARQRFCVGRGTGGKDLDAPSAEFHVVAVVKEGHHLFEVECGTTGTVAQTDAVLTLLEGDA